MNSVMHYDLHLCIYPLHSHMLASVFYVVSKIWLHTVINTPHLVHAALSLNATHGHTWSIHLLCSVPEVFG